MTHVWLTLDEARKLGVELYVAAELAARQGEDVSPTIGTAA